MVDVHIIVLKFYSGSMHATSEAEKTMPLVVVEVVVKVVIEVVA